MTYVEKYASIIMVSKYHYVHQNYQYPNRLFHRQITCLHPKSNFSMNPIIVNIKLLQIDYTSKFSKIQYASMTGCTRHSTGLPPCKQTGHILATINTTPSLFHWLPHLIGMHRPPSTDGGCFGKLCRVSQDFPISLLYWTLHLSVPYF